MSDEPRIGVLGVGRMGLPIAQNLVAAGRHVVVFDRNPERAADSGLAVARSATELAASVEVLLTVLPGTPELRECMLGAESLIGVLDTAALWIDLTSADPRVAQAIADRAADRGIGAVGAPMAGGPSAAAARTLEFFAAGTSEAIERARPVLGALGTVESLGDEIGMGYTTKLLTNLLWFGQVVAVTEALLLGQSLGLSPEVLRRRFASGAAASAFVDEYLDRLLDGDYLESFGIDRCVEELDTLASLADQTGVPFELSSTVARLHREALERFGPVGGELLAAKLLEDRAGRTLRH